MLAHRATVALPRSRRALYATAIFTALFGFQLLGLPQPITGPVVNAALYTAAILAGPAYAVAVGILTPTIAFIRGILPSPLAPMIPFIALSNAVLVLAFHLAVTKRRPGWGVLAASALKFATLALAVRYAVTVPPSLAVAMQTPQLLTALAGGYAVVAVGIIGNQRRRTRL